MQVLITYSHSSLLAALGPMSSTVPPRRSPPLSPLPPPRPPRRVELAGFIAGCGAGGGMADGYAALGAAARRLFARQAKAAAASSASGSMTHAHTLPSSVVVRTVFDSSCERRAASSSGSEDERLAHESRGRGSSSPTLIGGVATGAARRSHAGALDDGPLPCHSRGASAAAARDETASVKNFHATLGAHIGQSCPKEPCRRGERDYVRRV